MTSFGTSFVTMAQAQDAWPSKTGRVIVPSEPGAGLDLATRLLGEAGVPVALIMHKHGVR